MIDFEHYKKLVSKEIKDLNISIYRLEHPESDSKAVRLVTPSGVKCIFINLSNIENALDEFFVLVHELMHYRLNAFYTALSSEFTIEQVERIVNDAVTEFLSLQTLPEEDIIALPKDIQEQVHQYKLRKELSDTRAFLESMVC